MDFSQYLNAPSVLVQRTGAMGDAVWTTPLFDAMRNRLGYKGEVIVATEHPEVFENSPDVTHVINPNNLHGIQYETAWDLDWSYESNRKKHMLEAYCDVIGIDYESVRHNPVLYLSAKDKQLATGVVNRLGYNKQGIVVIHAAARSPDRIWSRAKWEELTTWLLSVGWAVVFVGTQGDFHPMLREGVLDLIGGTSLLETAALIEAAGIFIGPDSGIANVAFSTQTLAVVLYGMAKPRTRLPRDTAVIHRGVTADPEACKCLGCLDQIPAIEPPLCSRQPRAQCMTLISVDAVINEVLNLMRVFCLRLQDKKLLMQANQSTATI